MTFSNSSAAVAVAAAALCFSQPVWAQHVDQRLGKVHFATSCSPTAQREFDRAMLYQHSFWYRSSQRAFEETLKDDPNCAIAYWGIALSLLWNPHAPPPAKNLADGAASLAKGKAIGAKTERERDYLEALSAMYSDYDKVDHRTRVLNYLKAMEQLAARYPDDDEAQIYYPGAQCRGVAGRQDLCKSVERCGYSGKDLGAPARASGRGSLPDPSLRHSGAR